MLINSRPVFSGLASVYGLEILPANMIERVEIVRGGGSVLYSGNAVAGVVNLITKNPIGYYRNRTPFDANGDDFSEITEIKNNTIGIKAYHRPSSYK